MKKRVPKIARAPRVKCFFLNRMIGRPGCLQRQRDRVTVSTCKVCEHVYYEEDGVTPLKQGAQR